MQFDRNSSRFYEIFTWSGMTLSSLVLFSIGQSQFHAFKSLSVLNFFPVFGILNSQKYHLCFIFFWLPSIASGHFVAEILQKLRTLEVHSKQYFSLRIGSKSQLNYRICFILQTGAASYMAIIDTVVYFKSRCPLVIMLLEGRSVALSNILDNSWMCRKFCNQGNTLLKYFVVGDVSKRNGAVVLLARIPTLSYFTWKSSDSLI